MDDVREETITRNHFQLILKKTANREKTTENAQL